MRSFPRTFWTALAVVSIALGAGRAAALGISPNPVGTTTGLPAGGIVFDGSVAPTDITLLFTSSTSGCFP